MGMQKNNNKHWLSVLNIFVSEYLSSAGSHLFILVEQDELAVSQDAELPLPGSAVGVRTLTTGEPVSRRTFNVWNQTQDVLKNTRQ